MPHERDAVHLWDMLQAARGVMRATRGLTFEQYVRTRTCASRWNAGSRSSARPPGGSLERLVPVPPPAVPRSVSTGGAPRSDRRCREPDLPRRPLARVVLDVTPLEKSLPVKLALSLKKGSDLASFNAGMHE